MMKRDLVSTHAPLRGATRVSTVLVLLYHSFNPRTPAGCDSRETPTTPRTSGFNPRTPAGCDYLIVVILDVPILFQPTHPCGVRRGVESKVCFD